MSCIRDRSPGRSPSPTLSLRSTPCSDTAAEVTDSSLTSLDSQCVTNGDEARLSLAAGLLTLSGSADTVLEARKLRVARLADCHRSHAQQVHEVQAEFAEVDTMLLTGLSEKRHSIVAALMLLRKQPYSRGRGQKWTPRKWLMTKMQMKQEDNRSARVYEQQMAMMREQMERVLQTLEKTYEVSKARIEHDFQFELGRTLEDQKQAKRSEGKHDESLAFNF